MCPPGTYGDSYGLSSSACSGLCSAGFICGQGSIVHNERACGDPSVYCPTDGLHAVGQSNCIPPFILIMQPYVIVTQPVPVSQGYYSIGGVSPSTQIAQTIAPPGSYAVNGLLYPCPAGYFGALPGMYSSVCSGPCLVKGFWCPSGYSSLFI